MCAVLLHNLLRLYLLVEHVGFHLIDHRRYFAELRQVDEAVRIEVRHADGAELARLVRFLHRPPRAVVVVERLVNEQQVDVVGLQFAQRFVNACLCPLVSGIGNPHLRHDEQFFAGYAAITDSVAYVLLVAVSLCRVNHPVAHADGIPHAPLALRRRYLINSITQNRHFHAVT